MKNEDVIRDLKKVARADKAEFLPRFFKCGKGEYGEGDVFLGVVVPEQRKIAKKHATLGLSEIKKLLESKFHEARLTGLLILVFKFEKADEKMRKVIYNFYLKNTKRINNWDLVDLTAPRIVGGYLLDKDRKILYKLSRSKNLWERRIAILATFMFIREGDFKDALKISEILLGDKPASTRGDRSSTRGGHDLIHKAVGWMLREVGKRNLKTEEKFLQKHCGIMPRTMLRYAIEKFPENKRQAYLSR
jgi:3-methyladenine DNA glycosylase AlkD